jgi:pimeloyl-ACP methyl ester carboxylesterase
MRRLLAVLVLVVTAVSSPAAATVNGANVHMFSGLTTPVLQQHILAMMMAAPQQTADGAMQATWDRAQWSNEPIKAPTLAVYAGARPLSNEASITQLYPGAEYHQIPRTGHFLMMEKPDEFNALLTRFLDRIR